MVTISFLARPLKLIAYSTSSPSSLIFFLYIRTMLSVANTKTSYTPVFFPLSEPPQGSRSTSSVNPKVPSAYLNSLSNSHFLGSNCSRGTFLTSWFNSGGCRWLLFGPVTSIPKNTSQALNPPCAVQEAPISRYPQCLRLLV